MRFKCNAHHCRLPPWHPLCLHPLRICSAQQGSTHTRTFSSLPAWVRAINLAAFLDPTKRSAEALLPWPIRRNKEDRCLTDKVLSALVLHPCRSFITWQSTRLKVTGNLLNTLKSEESLPPRRRLTQLHAASDAAHQKPRNESTRGETSQVLG